MKQDYEDEASFKKDYIKELKSAQQVPTDVYQIESEETEPGFPDLLAITNGFAKMYELKVSDRYGTITFKKSQPAFYKRNSRLDILVVAFDRRSGIVHTFDAKELFTEGSYSLCGLKVRLP